MHSSDLGKVECVVQEFRYGCRDDKEILKRKILKREACRLTLNFEICLVKFSVLVR